MLSQHSITLTPQVVTQNEIKSLWEATQTTEIPHNLRYIGTFNFVGRQEAIEELHNLLNGFLKVVIASVSGMGGVGKTELALQYALRYIHCYPGGICWLDARGSDLGTQIIYFVTVKLSLNPPRELDISNKIEWCWSHWKPNGDVLLIVDDVIDYKEVLAFLPKHKNRFHIVMTSRAKPGQNIRELKLMPLSLQAALEMLSGLVSVDKVEKSLEVPPQICNWLGCLPLGIELVGRYVDNANFSLAEMLELLKNKRLSIRAFLNSESDMTAQRGVSEAFDLSWETLTPKARKLAVFLSLFALAPISWVWIKDCLIIDELEDLVQSLQILRKQHIVQTVRDGAYQLHPLIREFLRDKIQDLNDPEIIQSFCSFHTSLADKIPVPYLFNRELEEEITPIISHIEEVATSFVKYLSEDNLAKPFDGLAAFYQAQGTYYLAEKWLNRGLLACQNRFGLNHKNTTLILHSLAFLHYLKSEHDIAEPICRQVLELQTELLGEENLQIADTMDDLAKILSGKNEFIEAKSLYLRALKIRKFFLGEQHIDVVMTLSNIATCTTKQGLYLESERYFLEAIDIQISLGDTAKISLAFNLAKLSRVYTSMNRSADLEKLLKRILALKETYFESKHPFSDKILMALAKDHKHLGKFSEAKLYFEKTLEVLTETLGLEHQSTVDCKKQLLEII